MPDSVIKKDQWDFSYLNTRKHLKRTAVFYEYARHNKELVAWIKTVRELNVIPRFTEPTVPFQEPLPQTETFRARVEADSAYYSIIGLIFLVSCESFPDHSFETLMTTDPGRSLAYLFGEFGGRRGCLNELSRDEWKRFESTPDVDAVHLAAGYTINHFAIPWSHLSNAEIVKQFATWITMNRPQQLGEPRNLGRRSGKSEDANNKLNQLAALRFELHGFTRERARLEGFELYASKQRWQRAVNEARRRVDEMYRAPSDA